MLAVTISWIAISIVFLSFGDMIISLYNKLCKQDEQYGATDTFLLGMCFTLIPLSISSLWLPSNHYILFVYLILSALYWIIRKEHFLFLARKIKIKFSHLTLFHWLAFIIPIVSLMIVILWEAGVLDSLLYHQQNIRWNEEYSVVPGLGNIEHRFGFNSNYLLLSAIFSFRFIFGEAVYSLQVLVLVYIICWIIKEIIQSNYEIKRILLLFVITGYIFVFGYSLTATSTDAIPNIVSFYLIARLLLYPDSLKNKLLLFVFVPIALITFKLTMIPLCLISLFILVTLIRKKEYRPTLFLFVVPSVVVILWLIRNVIISGYLIFPFHEIDLFTVDWKVPQFVAVEEQDFILSCGIRTLGDIFWMLFNDFKLDPASILRWGVNFIFVAPILISPFVVLYSFFKKKHQNKTIYFVYIILAAVVGIWYKGGPDPRFIGGILFAVIYYILFMLLPTKEERSFPKLGMGVIILFSILIGYWAITRTVKLSDKYGLTIPTAGKRHISNILIRQYPYREILKASYLYTDEFHTYHLNNGISIYISKSPEVPKGRFVCFESPFPCTTLKADEPGKYQDISEIEARGSSLQDGFRSLILNTK